MMREAEGRTIQPLISAGKTQVPPGYTAGLRTPPIWNAPLDADLEEFVERRGRKWKEISTIIGDFTDYENQFIPRDLSALRADRSLMNQRFEAIIRCQLSDRDSGCPATECDRNLFLRLSMNHRTAPNNGT
jgi:hypothetical protein